MDEILKYFPELTQVQQHQFSLLLPLYKEWNQKINVISRKDIDNLYMHHVLHSLSIAKIISFKKETRILDVGTGGGFPGIPLAILFPEAKFHLIDSIGKKINVVNEVVKALELKNVSTQVVRAEEIKNTYHFIISRAVTDLQIFSKWCSSKLSKQHLNTLPNGILYLKGGHMAEELEKVKALSPHVYQINQFFADDYFSEKHIVYLSNQ